MREFTIQDASALARLLTSRGIMAEEEAGAFSVALNEIRDSATEIFEKYLPKLSEELTSNSDNVADIIFDIREECSHIHYHVKACKLSIDLDPWREILPKD
jgi:hypothetical protein